LSYCVKKNLATLVSTLKHPFRVEYIQFNFLKPF
jgi:hypothetical protein